MKTATPPPDDENDRKPEDEQPENLPAPKDDDPRSNEELFEELCQSLAATADGLRKAAMVVAKLDRRGFDWSNTPKVRPILPYLRKIACGQVLPEVIDLFRGRGTILEKAMALPIPDQRRIIDGEKLKVVVLKNGQVDSWLADPANMSTKVAQQVLAHDHIRDEREQVQWLMERKTQKSTVIETTRPDIALDKRGQAIVVKIGECSVRLSASELLHYLSQLNA